MSWDVGIVKKWVDELMAERKWPEVYRQQAYAILERLACLIDANNLCVRSGGQHFPVPLPAVINEVIPQTEGEFQSTLGLVWVAPGDHSLAFRWMPVRNVVEAVLEVSGVSKVEVTPTDDWILSTLARFGAKKS